MPLVLTWARALLLRLLGGLSRDQSWWANSAAADGSEALLAWGRDATCLKKREKIGRLWAVK
jgi:hypothetical protein